MKQGAIKIHVILLAAALVSMPFISSVGKESGLFGTMGSQLSYYFIFAGFIIWVLELLFTKKNASCLTASVLNSYPYYF